MPATPVALTYANVGNIAEQCAIDIEDATLADNYLRMQLYTMRAKKKFALVCTYVDQNPEIIDARLAVEELKRNLDTLDVILSGEQAVATLTQVDLDRLIEESDA